jgi:hypothetical protein
MVRGDFRIDGEALRVRVSGGGADVGELGGEETM